MSPGQPIGSHAVGSVLIVASTPAASSDLPQTSIGIAIKIGI
tara:strand:+ start:27590 stop:27715 length:126 start_codon:yes stop_codon:yes gene_type:complete